MPALCLRQVVKTYRSGEQAVKAVRGVDLQIRTGQIYGLLGPNGAGKSSLIGLISGTLLPDSGAIELFGVDVVADPLAAKQLLGVVPQEIVVEHAFTVSEVLHYFAGINGVPSAKRPQRIKTVLSELELLDKADTAARDLSGGMKRRLMIAKAILHRPRFLVLDEPTAGVDVELRQKIWQLVRQLNQAGTTILFTTHYLEEAEQLCDELTILRAGQIVGSGTMQSLRSRFDEEMIYFQLVDPARSTLLPGAKKIGTELELPTRNLAADLTRITQHYGTNLKSIRSEHASLEKIFLALTK